MPRDLTPTAALPYVKLAGASDMYEIESSRIALQKSQNAGVRQFAQQMIDHHTTTTQQVTAAAQSDGITPPPPMLLPPQRKMVADLQPLSGTSFDRTYLRQQRMAHDMALALHRTYSQSGDMPALRQTATTAVPIIQQHIQMLQAMPAS